MNQKHKAIFLSMQEFGYTAKKVKNNVNWGIEKKTMITWKSSLYKNETTGKKRKHKYIG